MGSANNWGLCDDGTQATGCGPQETYRNCADVSIGPVLMGVRGNQGANVRPPPQRTPPSKEFEQKRANQYHASSESRYTPEMGFNKTTLTEEAKRAGFKDSVRQDQVDRTANESGSHRPAITNVESSKEPHHQHDHVH